MNVGIVGSEAAKFTPETQALARCAIRSLIEEWHPSLIISGHSPLGGIDWWAIEEAEAAGVATREYPATRRGWDGPGGFKERNLQIAEHSDLVVCITLKTLPPSYRGMRFPRGCYHCQRYAPHFGIAAPGPEDHVKGGGCWTMWQAAHLGKKIALVILE